MNSLLSISSCGIACVVLAGAETSFARPDCQANGNRTSTQHFNILCCFFHTTQCSRLGTSIATILLHVVNFRHEQGSQGFFFARCRGRYSTAMAEHQGLFNLFFLFKFYGSPASCRTFSGVISAMPLSGILSALVCCSSSGLHKLLRREAVMTAQAGPANAVSRVPKLEPKRTF